MDKEMGVTQAEVGSSTHHSLSVKRESSELEQATPRRGTFGQKLKAHLKRWWWLHLIIGIAVLLLVTLILVYVGFPKISQSGVDNSTLQITSLIISNPTETSFHLNQAAIITSSSAYHPQLDAFNATVGLQGAIPYGTITIPPIHAIANSSTNIDQDVQIGDLDAFMQFNLAFFNEPSVNMAIQGSTGLHEMAFPETTVNYDKTVTLIGLNKLAGFNVTAFSILPTPLHNGTNMLGTVLIPNPSVFTFAMGNVTMALSVAGQSIGTSTLADLTITPGNNSYAMTSITNQTAVLELLSTTYKDGLLPVDIVGQSSVYDGVHLTYFESALASVTQHVVLNVGAALGGLL
ncbi:hypothetical protein MMC19_001886 [Ptychographa xylographoides]|nr:hypothetical protein [Ptychographa xylographoides]